MGDIILFKGLFPEVLSINVLFKITPFMAKIGYSLLILQTTNDPCSQLQQPLALENVLKITNWHQKKLLEQTPWWSLLKGKLLAVLFFLLWKKSHVCPKQNVEQENKFGKNFFQILLIMEKFQNTCVFILTRLLWIFKLPFLTPSPIKPEEINTWHTNPPEGNNPVFSLIPGEY